MTESEKRIFEEALKQARRAGDLVRDVKFLKEFGFKRTLDEKMRLMAERFQRVKMDQPEGESR